MTNHLVFVLCGGGWQHESVPSLFVVGMMSDVVVGRVNLSHPFYVIGKSPSVVVDSASLFHPLFFFLIVVITHGKSTSVDSTCVKWATRVSMVQVDNYLCNGLLERSI